MEIFDKFCSTFENLPLQKNGKGGKGSSSQLRKMFFEHLKVFFSKSFENFRQKNKKKGIGQLFFLFNSDFGDNDN